MIYRLVVIFFTFQLNSWANAQVGTESAAQIEFDQQSSEIYQSLGISEIPKTAFDEAYVAFHSLRSQGRLNNSPIITFVNFSIPSNQTRMFVVNLDKKSLVLSSNVTHGRNSGGVARPATSFSNVNDSKQSSLGFFITGEKYSGKHGTSMRLDGVSGNLNSLARNRAIVMHAARYAQSGGRSLGCFALPPSVNPGSVELLKNKTLLYAFTSNNFAKLGDKNSAIVASKDKNFDVPADVSGIGSEFSEFENLSVGKATPAIGVSGASASGITLLKGTDKYENCQNLSNKSWADTTAAISKGINPTSFFSGSWALLKNKIIEDEVDNEDAVILAQKQLSEINDCVAVAHTSTQTDFNKDNINTPETKKSSDGKITCVYTSPESQDYSSCISSIQAYEALNLKEQQLHAQQVENYTKEATENNSKLNIDNTQSVSLANVQKLKESHSNTAFARAEISNEKLNILAAIASKIPTRDSLYDECKSKFSRHGLVSISEYNEFTKMHSVQPVSFSPTVDHCMNAVTGSVKQIQNETARNQIKDVLKQFGKEADEYTSKANGLLNQASSSMGNGSNGSFFGMNQTDSSNSSASSNSAESGTEMNSVFSGQGPLELYFPPTSKSTGVISVSNTENAIYNSGSSSKIGLEENLINFENRNVESSSSRTGIYNIDFYSKIKLALADPSKLKALELSNEQMKEYVLQKKYLDSLKITNTSNDSQPSNSLGKLSSSSKDLHFIHKKEESIFDIISTRYRDTYSEVFIER